VDFILSTFALTVSSSSLSRERLASLAAAISASLAA